MNARNDSRDEEEIMLAFSVEPSHGPETLQRYLGLYPHLAGELLDLALELRLESGVQLASSAISPEAEAAWHLFVSRTEMPITAQQVAEVRASLIAPAMKDIGLPLSVLAAIRSGFATVEEFPDRWMRRISDVGGYARETLRSYIARPPAMSQSMSFKSEGKPAAGGKVTFRELVESTTLTQAEKAEILRED